MNTRAPAAIAALLLPALLAGCVDVAKGGREVLVAMTTVSDAKALAAATLGSAY